MPVIQNGSSQSRWQTHKCKTMDSGLCCREIFRKFLTWPEPEPKRQNVRYPAHNLQNYQWKAYTPKGCLLGVSTHHLSTIPNGNPKPPQILVMKISFISNA